MHVLPRCSFYIAFATVQNLLLAPVAYDHYTAVCKSLHYTTIMMTSVCVCVCLVIGSCIHGVLNTSNHIRNTFVLIVCSIWYITFSVIFQQSCLSFALIDVLVS